MRTAKVIEVLSDWTRYRYLQLELPDGSRAAVPCGLDVQAGDILTVSTPNEGTNESDISK